MKKAGLVAGVPLSRIKSVGLPLKTIPVGAASVPGENPQILARRVHATKRRRLNLPGHGRSEGP
jgi:hypothetical protein